MEGNAHIGLVEYGIDENLDVNLLPLDLFAKHPNVILSRIVVFIRSLTIILRIKRQRFAININYAEQLCPFLKLLQKRIDFFLCGLTILYFYKRGRKNNSFF